MATREKFKFKEHVEMFADHLVRDSMRLPRGETPIGDDAAACIKFAERQLEKAKTEENPAFRSTYLMKACRWMMEAHLHEVWENSHRHGALARNSEIHQELLNAKDPQTLAEIEASRRAAARVD